MQDQAKLQLRIDKLWALEFGNGSGRGLTTTLYYTAGTFSETYGTFGSIVPAPARAQQPERFSRKAEFANSPV